ncbi:MAG: glycosyl transferase [Phreatobacter sp.]|uniref:glycosyl transferase n=1 Tax=Phreatobacter sp. TaxID=1966341 RepID=UPI001A3CB0E0|nr:glycosyl transferase [Phreatobacter sp.]MBL8571938.1 glycosyl transferase [Phreatobacter sp.]
MLPWLGRVAAAVPDARSSHASPTPQGGGIGAVAAMLATGLPALYLSGAFSLPPLACCAGLAALCALGFADDRRPLGWRSKLVAQALTAAAVAAFMPPGAFAPLPAPVAWVLSAMVLLVTVNLVNFIDGIDEITVAHAAPAFAAATAVASAGGLALAAGPLAAAGLGATLGFWLWNRHPARVFLGDSGSLPLGLLLGWLALALAAAGHAAAAVLILLYPLVDGGLTLIRRLMRGENLARPHRDHAYQRAVDTGVPMRRVAITVGLISTGNALLALATVLWASRAGGIGALTLGAAWTLIPILVWLRRERARP